MFRFRYKEIVENITYSLMRVSIINSKPRGFLLTVVLVCFTLSVVVVGLGSAVASTPQDRSDGDRGSAGSYDVSTSSGEVGPGATIFQGEGDITLVAANGSEVNPQKFERTNGPHAGTTLELPVPETQPTGTYAHVNNSSHTLTVQRPRIERLELIDEEGNDLSGGSIDPVLTNNLAIKAEYNFEEVEPLNITVTKSSSVDDSSEVVTSDVLAEKSVQATSTGELSVAMNEREIQRKEHYVSVEGDKDLNFGPASNHISFDMLHYHPAQLEIETERVVQGETVNLGVQRSTEGARYLVAVEANDIDGDPERVFKDTEYTVATAQSADGDALALIKIDGGRGKGAINTSHLKPTEVTAGIYNRTAINNRTELQNIQSLERFSDPVGESIEVIARSVHLRSPQGTYTVGSNITISGTASGVDTVGLYARNGSRFEYLMTLAVDRNGTFAAEAVELSDPSDGAVANATLGNPGTYQLAVVSTDDRALAGNYRANQRIDAIRRAVSSQSSLNVTYPQPITDSIIITSITGENGRSTTVAPNATMNISGVTTASSDNTTITAGVIEHSSSDVVASSSTGSWGSDGRWHIELNTTGIRPGNYTVEANISQNADSQRIQVVSAGETNNESPATGRPATPETATTDEQPATTTVPEPSTTPTVTTQSTTTNDGPGFTAALTFIVLVVTALLAAGRHA